MGNLGVIIASGLVALLLIGLGIWFFFFKKKTSGPGTTNPYVFTANIVGPDINTPIENIGFYKPDDAYYVAALVPNTTKLVILQVKFYPKTWNVSSSISRVLENGAARRRVTGTELEIIYADAILASDTKYGDRYKLTDIVGTTTPLT